MKENGDIVSFFKQKEYVMINNQLGRGSFGKTVLLQDPFIDILFVAKKYEPEFSEIKEQFYQSFLQEIKIMYKLSHRNIVRIYNYYPYETKYTGYILMEHIDGQNIADYFEQYAPWDDGPSPDNIFIQLIDGFHYISKNNIVHRDIREGNILVDKSGIAKIIDFGLGKIFRPIDITEDSMAEEINRSGLDKLPDEHFHGLYDSQTDMFYLAELINRLLVKHHIDNLFSYQLILDKMMSSNKENRFSTFADIQEAIHKKDFSTFNISNADKKIYQAFSNAILNHLREYTSEKKFNYDVSEFQNKLLDIITKNCFEDDIQDNRDLIRSIVSCAYKYSPIIDIKLKTVTDFYNWFGSLSASSQQLVLNNIIAKLSSVEEKLSDKLPF